MRRDINLPAAPSYVARRLVTTGAWRGATTWSRRDCDALKSDTAESLRGKPEKGAWFGNVSFWLFWDNGYQALASLDDNGDGALSSAELNGLAIWHDANGDGRCDSGEVRPLATYGIVSLSCRHQTPAGNKGVAAFSPEGVRFADGKTRPTYDVILEPAR